MASLAQTPPPLTRASIEAAHERIKAHIHLTPVLTSRTLSEQASTPQPPSSTVPSPAHPRINLFFKCENFQRIGAFKARGAFHALSRLTPSELSRGVVTHSSGNHAQALALAARTYGVKAYVVMPSISTPSKIEATRGYGAEVIFSGSTAPEREEVVRQVMQRTGAVLVPPYDHPDIILGQGTVGLEFQAQVQEFLGGVSREESKRKGLDVLIAPCGGGGLLSGIATALADTRIRVFGAEPSFQGADDARRGLLEGHRIDRVKTLTIADGLRTPVGVIPWQIISDPTKVRGIYCVTEEQIKRTLKLVIERMKIFVEPSAVVGLAVVLFDEEFRSLVQKEIEAGGKDSWNVGVVLTGGNTTLQAVGEILEDIHV